MDPLNHVPSCHFLCPKERYEQDKEHTKPAKRDGRSFQFNYRIVKSSCLSEKPNNLHSLFLLINKVYEVRTEHYSKFICCEDCHFKIDRDTYYFCSDCKGVYHKECVESPSIYHSYDHPKHPLQLLWSDTYPNSKCFRCQIDIFSCLSYYCLICNFSLHVRCSRNPTSLLTIDNPKRHKHTLHYFPRKSNLACDVCGLVNDHDHGQILYACLLCDFFVHKSCIGLPYVIKVSRHSHRLAFAPSSPFKEESADCGVCYQKIDINYGEYSCVKGCVYAMHARCALRSDVSDGKELEGEPEETTYENTKLFEDKGDGVILHQSHPCHQMKLEKQFYDENKHCQACMLPFCDDGNAYRCMQYCDFILHEACAYLPRVKQFLLHVHPLILELGYTTRWCLKCRRPSCGFAYVCPIKDCPWRLDTLCASISEPFNHYAHPHPLFITSGFDELMECSICQSNERQPLNCAECGFVVCFFCATPPYKRRYKHDEEHLLLLSYKEDTNDDDDDFYWCEICEENILPQRSFYACNECGVTLHVDCLLGRDPYMKSGQTVFTWRRQTREKVHYLSNTDPVRPICKGCQRRCPYKVKIETSSGDQYCSFICCLEN